MSIQVTIGRDTATPALESLKGTLAPANIKRAVAASAVKLTKDYLNSLPPNKRGWTSTGFYKDAARGTTFDFTETGVVIHVENENAPGAMAFRFHGGTINAKNVANLAIPARQEFYGHSPTEFNNLRFVMFKSGAKALVVGTGGTERANSNTWKSGRGTSLGTGARTAMMIAYWLVPSVTQNGNPNVIPSPDAYVENAKTAVIELLNNRK